MEKQIRWLRISYWTGAVIDGLAALQLLVPNVFATIDQLPDFHPSFAYTCGRGGRTHHPRCRNPGYHHQ